MRVRARRPLAVLRNALVIATALAAFGAAPAFADHGWGWGGEGSNRDAVYTETNNPAGNAVVVFARHRDGTITQRQVVPTGGTGTASQPPFGFPIVDSQGAINLTNDGRLLFVVNSGDNSVSSFRVRDDGLTLADHFVLPAGNVLPISVTSSGDLLYVLNGVSGNIYGLRFSHDGDLTGIPGSSQPLSAPGSTGVPAQIGFAPGGSVLTVTERCYVLPAGPDQGCPNGNGEGIIDTFAVGRNGAAGPAQVHPSNAFGPFGFAYQGPHHLLVSDTGFIGSPPNPAGPGTFISSASSYDLSDSGALASDGSVLTGGRGACWTVITGDGRHMFITNSLSATIPGSGQGGVARFSLSPNGTPTLLGDTDVSPSAPVAGVAFPTDLALSSDSRYLYVLVPTLNMLSSPANNDTSHIDVFRVGWDGSLTHIQTTPDTLPGGVSGMGAF